MPLTELLSRVTGVGERVGQALGLFGPDLVQQLKRLEGHQRLQAGKIEDTRRQLKEIRKEVRELVERVERLTGGGGNSPGSGDKM